MNNFKIYFITASVFFIIFTKQSMMVSQFLPIHNINYHGFAISQAHSSKMEKK